MVRLIIDGDVQQIHFKNTTPSLSIRTARTQLRPFPVYCLPALRRLEKKAECLVSSRGKARVMVSDSSVVLKPQNQPSPLISLDIPSFP